MITLSPIEDLTRAWPGVEWGLLHPPDRDTLVLIGTLHGHRVRRELHGPFPGRTWHEALAGPVREILEELGLLGPVAREEHPAAAVYAPAHGGYSS